jgi:hypothetical protein
MICLSDLMATCADILDVKLTEDAGEDSVSILSLLRGKKRHVRDAIVSHSINGRFAIRDQRWKLMLCPGSGGWGSPKDDEAVGQGLPPVQLYDMDEDIGEQRNLESEFPKIVEELTRLLEKYVQEGRSTPGSPQQNDVPIDIWKRS